MLTTIVFVSLCVGALVFQYLLWFVLLKAGLRWAKIEGVTTGRLLRVILLILIVLLAVTVVDLFIQPDSPPLQILNALGLLVAEVLLLLLLICRLFGASWQKALLALLPTLLAPVAGVLLIYVVLHPFLFEGFTSPANDMAPTLLGNHFTATCATCGKPSYGWATLPGASERESPAICSEFHVHAVMPAGKTREADKFLVAKFLRPQRWDVIAFRGPGDPSLSHVKRLVGLPGETVFIKDGAVWINGQKLEPPPSLKRLSYVTELPHMPSYMRVAGTLDHPAVLGADEYFVLGDFSSQSMDLRLWEKSAPGHPAYAVPESYIVGVVTHIYWPPSRWRILR